jgi:DNA repair protein RadC
MDTATTRRARAVNPLSIQLATTLNPAEHRAVVKALAILDAKMQRDGLELSSPSAAHAHFSCLLGGLAAEAFAVAFVDSQHRVIASQIMFTGSVTSATVHPREVAKAALLHNAAAVVVAHNHPGGSKTFSKADRQLTEQINKALHLLDVRLLDHLLIVGGEAHSAVEHGLI